MIELEQLQRLPVRNYDEYSNYLLDGYKPLIDWKRFDIDVDLRIAIQNELFGKSQLGKGSVVGANQKYYKWCYDNKLQICEECTTPIHQYSAINISHILARGGHAEMAHDPRNSRILCGTCHPLAEAESTHVKMKIWQTDQIIIQMLKYEY